MFVCVIKAKSIIRGSLFLLGAIVLIVTVIGFISSSDVVGAFKADKELPIYYVDTANKVAAITFDCAWEASDIPDILKTLKEENVKATFFIVGQWAEKYPEAVRMIAEAGHDIANHSYSHLRMGAIDSDRIRSEIEKCGDTLSKITGNKVDLFRAPYGDYTNSVINTARDLGYYTIQWDVDSLDWKPDISQQEIMSRIMRKIKKGSVILFHNDTPHTANMLPDIITAIKKQGYTLVPVSEMILRENYEMDFDGKQKRKQ